MGKRSLLPWRYRPLEHDDWGIIRGLDGSVVAVARAGSGCTESDLQQHRRNKTDPYGPNAAFIVKAVNNHEALVKALTDLSDMYTHAWDRVDGGLTMFGASVERFEKAHYAAQIAVCDATGKPRPVDFDDDDDLGAVGGPAS